MDYPAADDPDDEHADEAGLLYTAIRLYRFREGEGGEGGHGSAARGERGGVDSRMNDHFQGGSPAQQI